MIVPFLSFLERKDSQATVTNNMHYVALILMNRPESPVQANVMMDKEYNKLFRQYFNPVKSFIRKLVKSDDDAEDLAQDVFAHLWTKPHIWQNNPEIDRYIYRMAKYQALTFLRDYARKFDRGLVEADKDQVEAITSDISTIDPIIYDEAQMLLDMAMEKMPPKRREIFALSRFDGLSHKEIAQKLGLSVRTIESHIYAALATLKEHFPR